MKAYAVRHRVNSNIRLDKYSHSEWREEPLDGDEVDRLVNILRNDLNLLNGNLTHEEYIKVKEL